VQVCSPPGRPATKAPFLHALGQSLWRSVSICSCRDSPSTGVMSVMHVNVSLRRGVQILCASAAYADFLQRKDEVLQLLRELEEAQERLEALEAGDGVDDDMSVDDDDDDDGDDAATEELRVRWPEGGRAGS
jgi:hypothetical protein